MRTLADIARTLDYAADELEGAVVASSTDNALPDDVYTPAEARGIEKALRRGIVVRASGTEPTPIWNSKGDVIGTLTPDEERQVFGAQQVQPEPLTDPLAPCPYCGSLVEQSLLDDGFRDMNMARHGLIVTDVQPEMPTRELFAPKEGERCVCSWNPAHCKASAHSA
jgi:hypothetical protein